jgi:hypothetical protein
MSSAIQGQVVVVAVAVTQHHSQPVWFHCSQPFSALLVVTVLQEQIKLQAVVAVLQLSDRLQ